MKQYKMMLRSNDFWFYSDNLEFLIKKVEFFNTFRNGVRSKPKVVCCKTGRVVYE
jgi:hypothetical protein